MLYTLKSHLNLRSRYPADLYINYNYTYRCPADLYVYRYNTCESRKYSTKLKDFLESQEQAKIKHQNPTVNSNNIKDNVHFSFINLALVATFYEKVDDTVKKISNMTFIAVKNQRIIKALFSMFGDQFDRIHMLSLFFEEAMQDWSVCHTPLLLINSVKDLTALLINKTQIKELNSNDLQLALLAGVMCHLNKHIPDYSIVFLSGQEEEKLEILRSSIEEQKKKK